MQASLIQRTFKLPQTTERLKELAYNLWFSWNQEAIELFKSIDPPKWEEIGHNPVRLLQETEYELLLKLSQDSSFLDAYQKVIAQYDAYLSGVTWFQENHPKQINTRIAYFSAEFGFHDSLPIYSGGLGVLAGDHCKSASDLGIPLTGMGLLYKKGYFTQKIDGSGGQLAELSSYDYSAMPIQPVYQGDQELRVQINMPSRTIVLKVWAVQVGRITVYLLDADIEINSQADRELTAQLYGGNQETRISQEILLGMGGVEALRALGIYPHVYHMNEGHAAFLTLSRLKELVQLGLPFHVALETVRSATVFTTHTPVAAGHDAFPIPMTTNYLEPLLSQIPVYRKEVMALGTDPKTGLFNMTHLALNTSSLRNGVSKLHGEVSRNMFRDFHGNVDAAEVPIDSITNGVHIETWLAPEWKALLDRFLPATWRSGPEDKRNWNSVELIPNASIWDIHQELKGKMIKYARRNLMEQRRRNGESEKRIAEVHSYLSKDTLTIGFARRFATYKRATLIFNNLYRLKKLIHQEDRPIQFIFAGKAHPADRPAQELIREIYRVSQLPEFLGKIVLLENYDMNMARYLVQGVDLWLNNPRRPLEASGTSGQKAAMNGVINFSVLDGWWEEGYNGNNGWSIGSTDDKEWPEQERENTEAIYRILEAEIVPLYYNQGKLPEQWINRMKRSIQTLAPVYNTNRMVQEYTVGTYLPTAERAIRFLHNDYDIATKVADYKRFIQNNWHHVQILSVDDRAALRTVDAGLKPQSNAETKEITVDVFFGPIWPADTLVEIVYYEESNKAWEQVVVSMQASGEFKEQIQRYNTAIPKHLLHGPHFSVRVRPVSPDFAHSFELPLAVSTLRK